GGVAGRDGLTPRRRQRRGNRTRERLVLCGLHVVRAQVVLVDERAPASGRDAVRAPRRDQLAVVAVPAAVVRAGEVVEALLEAPARRADGAGARLGAAERHLQVALVPR